MVSPPRRERLDLLIVAMLFVGQSLGNEYMMTCSRPVATKTPRVLKLDLGLPCDLSVESWCNLPGDKYPWHAVRSFVFENQGLMRRMYGEVRQLSVLRMEFNGNSIDENTSVGREFDELFKPVSPTTTTSTTTTTTTTASPTTHKTTSTSSTTETAQKITTTLLSSSSSSSSSSPSPSSPSTFSTSAESLSSSSSSPSSPHPSNTNFDYDNLNVSSDSYVDDVQNNSDKNNPNVSSSSGSVANNNNSNRNHNDSDGGSSGESVIKSAAAADYNSDYLSDQAQTTTEESGQTEGTTLFEQRDVVEAAEVTTEPVHILFQDAEKTTTSRTSTSTSGGSGTGSDIAADDPESPQQVHRSDIKGVNACPVKEEVVAPYWANNTRGEVLALLNLYPFEQYIHWEKCTFEHRQMYCREGCRCEQQYRLHRLLAFDPTNECRGIFSDWFRFPSCCVCKCYLTSSDLAQERFSFNRSPRFDDTDIPDVNGVDDSHFYYKTNNFFNLRQPR